MNCDLFTLLSIKLTCTLVWLHSLLIAAHGSKKTYSTYLWRRTVSVWQLKQWVGASQTRWQPGSGTTNSQLNGKVGISGRQAVRGSHKNKDVAIQFKELSTPCLEEISSHVERKYSA
ncbi:hypothetical protein EB796_007356 [Bugula neritina]|uniref:Uncharacterized protein n=1 Tax=Bugula neritina TaxID=10212 RepID=A0A7J7K918_BUGNE|nr:hypothetical protein EB796_007356 [Bugula neritina]